MPGHLGSGMGGVSLGDLGSRQKAFAGIRPRNVPFMLVALFFAAPKLRPVDDFVLFFVSLMLAF